MPNQLNIMSWNIKDLGDKKLSTPFPKKRNRDSNDESETITTNVIKVIKEVVRNNTVDLLLIMEVSSNARDKLSQDLITELNASEGSSEFKWQYFCSEAAKRISAGMPDKLGIKGADNYKQYSFENQLIAGVYYFDLPNRELNKCYDCTAASKDAIDKNTVWTLKSGCTEDDLKDACQKLLAANVIKKSTDAERYAAFFKYNTVNSTNDVYSNGSFSLLQKYNSLVYKDKAGTILGYQQFNSLFNGRSPYFICLQTNETSPRFVPVLLFHAPFQDKVPQAVKTVRVPAIKTLLDIAVTNNDSNTIEMKDSDYGVICGDFNVAYEIPLQAPYKELNNKGYQATIDAITTQGKEKYDNILLKWKPAINPSPSGNAVQVQDLFPDMGIVKSDESQDSLKELYWNKVSDHLPVLLKVTLP